MISALVWVHLKHGVECRWFIWEVIVGSVSEGAEREAERKENPIYGCVMKAEPRGNWVSILLPDSSFGKIGGWDIYTAVPVTSW